MPRFDPWAAEHCLPEAAPVTRALRPDFTITLRPLDELDENAVYDQVQAWEADYLKGDKALAVPDEVRRKLSRFVLHNIAVIQRMEVVPEGETGYDLAGWLGVVKNCKPLWRELIKFSNEVQSASDPKN